ncbi:unnamed protein product, partial [Polarella glacialis]
DVVFPGGYSKQEFSEKSPLRRLRAFPSELVLLGRASVLVKGVAARLGVQWSVAKKWEPLAKACITALCSEDECRLPAWALTTAAAQAPVSASASGRLSFADAARGCASLVRRWGLDKAASIMAARRLKKVEKEKAGSPRH